MAIKKVCIYNFGFNVVQNLPNEIYSGGISKIQIVYIAIGEDIHVVPLCGVIKQ
jgi:hypothetical protein